MIDIEPFVKIGKFILGIVGDIELDERVGVTFLD
jgi:hypothetical protein